jgi:class 3 adenylate cyclase/tetratricopeptide (TPR) repeat protein
MNCSRCQTANPEGARFCLNCGTPLEAARPVEGERKFVTVLFADVVDSTGMGERLDPEQVIEIMNGAFAFLNVAVAKYDGTVARLMGDAVLAFFGAPVAHEDDPERALRAALEIQAAAKEYGRGIEATYGVDFDVRVGINTGLAVLAVVGDEIKTEYTAMGDTTNVAARLQSAATPGTVLISANTYHLVKELFEFEPRGAIEVKGRSMPVETYEAVAPRTVPGKVRGLEGVTSPLVGRTAELQLVLDKLEVARRGRGSLVAVIGEAGLGKSRLLAEARRLATADPKAPVTWLEGRALSYEQAVTYYPWREVIRGAIHAKEGEAPEVVRERLRCDRACCAMPGGDVQFLEVMLSVESDATLKALTGLEGDELVQHITEATRGYLCARAERMPTVIVLDDLHWADTASLDLLMNVAGLVEDLPLLIICLLRPDKDAPSWSIVERSRGGLGSVYTEIALEPLDAAHAQELLGNLLHVEDLPESVRELALKKSEGNPFFLEEVLRALIDSGHIVRQNGHWRATREITNVTIPDTLAGVLSARIDRLPDNTKQVAQTAAVLGRIFEHRALTTVCAAAPPPERIEDVGPHLGVLAYAELVRERMPELEYIFKHALTREAAYELLLLRRRKELHRRAGEALEQLHPEHRDELAPALAYHFRQGEEWQRSADYAMRAGAQAVKVYAMSEALAYYDNAYEALKKIPDASPQQLCDAILGWTPAALKLRPYQQAIDRLREAEEIARELDDEGRLTRVLHWIANAYISNGFPSLGMPALFESYQLAERLGEERLTLVATFWMTADMIDRDPRGALKQMDYVVEAAHKYRRYELEAHALAKKAIAHARLGEFAEAEDAVERAFEASGKTDSVVNGADVALGSSLAFLDMGDARRGLEYSRRGTEQALSAYGLECAMYGHYCTGLANLHSRNPAEAQRAFESALEMLDEHLFELQASQQMVNQVRALLAIARFLAGDTGVIDDIKSGLANAEAMGDDYIVAFISQALGEAYTHLADFERAKQYLDTALDYYRRNDMRPYLARGLRSLAYLYEEQGRGGEAERARAEASRLMEDLPLPQVGPLGGFLATPDESEPADS